jgi:ADP-ribosyl-[dinitrogen reductase] hydrolase
METVSVTEKRRKAILGCLLGTAVGDAIGLPVEGLSRKRQRRLFGKIEGHRLLFGHGMISDDTEHTIFTAQALLVCQDSPERFATRLATELRRWILLVPAGVGLATLRASLKLMAGVSPDRSGVFSAGNGPAMRAALLGIEYGDNLKALKAFVRASARLTHTDPKAEYGAFAVALAAHFAANNSSDPHAFLAELQTALPHDPDAQELLRLLIRATESAERNESTSDFAASTLGRSDRVTGYIYQTVPAALHAWMRFPTDYRSAVLSVIACGGDTDTTAAITGAIVGAGVGEQEIPTEWIEGLWEWPYSISWIRGLGERLAAKTNAPATDNAPRVFTPALMLRNSVFLLVVLLTLLRWYIAEIPALFRSVITGTLSQNY